MLTVYFLFIFIFLFFSDRTVPMKTFARVLGNYESLKKQFDWLIDGEVAHLVHDNLRPELKNIELFLRWVVGQKEKNSLDIIKNIMNKSSPGIFIRFPFLRIRIWIQLFSLVRIRIQLFFLNANPDPAAFLIWIRIQF